MNLENPLLHLERGDAINIRFHGLLNLFVFTLGEFIGINTYMKFNNRNKTEVHDNLILHLDKHPIYDFFFFQIIKSYCSDYYFKY